MISIAAPGDVANLGGTSLGAFTAGGLAAVITALLVLLLKKGGNPKIAKFAKWEFMVVGGFIAASLYAAAGWNFLANAIHSASHPLAASWGAGAVALIVTLFIITRTHTPLRATSSGFVAAVLYNAAGGYWALVSTWIATTIHSWKLGG